MMISYASFAQLKPFYVLSPNVSKRNTVQCKLHENCHLQARKLHQLGVLSSQYVNDIMTAIVCSVTSKACMYLECDVCANKLINTYTAGKCKRMCYKLTLVRTMHARLLKRFSRCTLVPVEDKPHSTHAMLRWTTCIHTYCCTVSEDLRHEPAAIWAHLRPVIQDLRQKGIPWQRSC